MILRKTDFNIVKQYIEELGYELISKEYLNNAQKLILKDIIGYYYVISFNSLKSGSIPLFVHKSNPYTIQNIKLWCKLNNKSFELLSDIYENAHNNLQWKCLKEECNEIFYMNWNSIYSQNQNCSFCSGHQIGLSNCLATKRPDLAKEWHSIKNGKLTPYDVTCGSHEYIWWQCSKNPKHEWYVMISDRDRGRNCPYCSGRYASEDYNLLVNNPELCEEWNYNKNEKRPEEYTPFNGKKVWWLCKECGHEWKVSIINRNKGWKTGCPECNKSKGEKECKRVLISKDLIEISQDDYDNLIDKNKYNNNYFIPQKEFEGLIGTGEGLLSYDFYTPKLNLLIEYQGEQHEKYIPGFHKSIKDFEKQQEHDRRKREYAQKHNINLLEIWYWDFNNIEQILTKELNTISNNLQKVS